MRDATVAIILTRKYCIAVSWRKNVIAVREITCAAESRMAEGRLTVHFESLRVRDESTDSEGESKSLEGM